MNDPSGFQVAGSAPHRYEEFNAPIMAPFVAALLAGGRIETGQAVLDVACGTGFVARAAAGKVGPSGRIVGVDINRPMLELAGATSPGIEWREAGADRLPFPDATFDAVLCQQGLQFFPDPKTAMAEAARVTRPGGRVAATVWLPVERSDYMAAQFRAVDALLGPEGSASFLDAFSCTEADVTAAFRSAGLSEIEATEVVAEVRLPALSEFFPGQLGALPWGAAIAAAHPDGVERATAIVVDLLDLDPDGSATVRFGSLLVTAVR